MLQQNAKSQCTECGKRLTVSSAFRAPHGERMHADTQPEGVGVISGAPVVLQCIAREEQRAAWPQTHVHGESFVASVSSVAATSLPVQRSWSFALKKLCVSPDCWADRHWVAFTADVSLQTRYHRLSLLHPPLTPPPPPFPPLRLSRLGVWLIVREILAFDKYIVCFYHFYILLSV